MGVVGVQSSELRAERFVFPLQHGGRFGGGITRVSGLNLIAYDSPNLFLSRSVLKFSQTLFLSVETTTNTGTQHRKQCDQADSAVSEGAPLGRDHEGAAAGIAGLAERCGRHGQVHQRYLERTYVVLICSNVKNNI